MPEAPKTSVILAVADKSLFLIATVVLTVATGPFIYDQVSIDLLLPNP